MEERNIKVETKNVTKSVGAQEDLSELRILSTGQNNIETGNEPKADAPVEDQGKHRLMIAFSVLRMRGMSWIQCLKTKASLEQSASTMENRSKIRQFCGSL